MEIPGNAISFHCISFFLVGAGDGGGVAIETETGCCKRSANSIKVDCGS